MSLENPVEDLPEEETHLGIPDDTPDEIKTFILANDIADKFSVMLKVRPDQGGTPQYIKSFTNWYPRIDDIGKRWGPGSYELVFTWRALGIDNKRAPVTRSYKVELSEAVWQEPHEEYLLERTKKKREKSIQEWRAEADKNAAMGINSAPPPPPVSELDTLRKMLGIAKDMGVPIGNQRGPVEKEKTRKTFGETLIELAPAITAIGGILTPVALAIINRPKVNEDRTLQNTLLTHVLTNKPQENEVMKQFPSFLMGVMKQVMDFKESLQPEEKVSLVEKIFDKLAPIVPAVLQLATQPKAAIDSNPMVQMARNMPEIRALAGDEEALELFVKRYDEVYGFQQANDILAVGGLTRPASLRDAYKDFPSVGWGKDGKRELSPEEAARAPQDIAPPEPDENMLD